MPQSRTEVGRAPWLERAMWALLSAAGVAILLLAVWLLYRSGALGTGELETEDSKGVWAFLGLALGAVVTLVGTLLTAQNNRRVVEQTREADARERLATVAEEDRQQRLDLLAQEAEDRVRQETVAAMLDRLVVDGEYARPAVVAGALAAMVELKGVTVGVRVLRELWAAGAVDDATALWFANRTLERGEHPGPGHAPGAEVYAAAELLAINAGRILPHERQRGQLWVNWPDVLRDEHGEDRWPSHLSSATKFALIVFCVKALLSRPPTWWEQTGREPIDSLKSALADDDVAWVAASVLRKLDALKMLERLDVALEQPLPEGAPAGWFEVLIDQLDPWAEDVPVRSLEGQGRTLPAPRRLSRVRTRAVRPRGPRRR